MNIFDPNDCPVCHEGPSPNQPGDQPTECPGIITCQDCGTGMYFHHQGWYSLPAKPGPYCTFCWQGLTTKGQSP